MELSGSRIILATLATLVVASEEGDLEPRFTPDPMCPWPSEITVRFPYYGNCSVYWECFEGIKYQMECPIDWEFNRAVAECDDPYNFDCDPYEPTIWPTWETTKHTTTTKSTTTKTTTTSKPTTNDDVDPRCEDGEVSYWPHPSDCSKYIECYGGEAFEMDCPENLYFSDSKKMCTEESESECCAEQGGCESKRK